MLQGRGSKIEQNELRETSENNQYQMNIDDRQRGKEVHKDVCEIVERVSICEGLGYIVYTLG